MFRISVQHVYVIVKHMYRVRAIYSEHVIASMAGIGFSVEFEIIIKSRVAHKPLASGTRLRRVEVPIVPQVCSLACSSSTYTHVVHTPPVTM